MNIAMTTKDIAPITMPTLAPVERPPPGDDIGRAVGVEDGADTEVELEVDVGSDEVVEIVGELVLGISLEERDAVLGRDVVVDAEAGESVEVTTTVVGLLLEGGEVFAGASTPFVKLR